MREHQFGKLLCLPIYHLVLKKTLKLFLFRSMKRDERRNQVRNVLDLGSQRSKTGFGEYYSTKSVNYNILDRKFFGQFRRNTGLCICFFHK